MPEDMAGDARGDDDTGAGERLPHDGPDRRTGQATETVADCAERPGDLRSEGVRLVM